LSIEDKIIINLVYNPLAENQIIIDFNFNICNLLVDDWTIVGLGFDIYNSSAREVLEIR
ncbi:856_t:CDS:1, partial [Rhizophagus irregularis]